MPAHDSPTSRRNDQEIHEALVSGLTPQQVAAQFSLSVNRVLTAERRVQTRRAALLPEDAEREAQLEILRVTGRLALEAFQRSLHEPEEITKVSSGGTAAAKKAERTLRKKPPDPRYLRIALAALAERRKLAAATQRPTEVTRAEVTRAELERRGNMPALRQAMLMHPDFMAFVRSFTKASTGISLPKIDFSDPMFDPKKSNGVK